MVFSDPAGRDPAGRPAAERATTGTPASANGPSLPGPGRYSAMPFPVAESGRVPGGRGADLGRAEDVGT